MICGHSGKAAAMSAIVHREPGRAAMWWARGLTGPKAAAVTVRNVGNTALVLNSSAGGNTEPLVELLRQLTAGTLAGGVTFVQAMLNPCEQAEAAVYIQAEYFLLAQLIYMRRPGTEVGPEEPRGLAWATLAEAGEAELAKVIADTYVDSLDCPALLGLRPMADVIAAHKGSGIHRPEHWWIPSLNGQSVGCILLNDAANEPHTSDVVYLGIRPAWRQQGLGRVLLRQAMRAAISGGARAITLAVDGSNLPAVKFYRQEGFEEIDRKDVYIRSARGVRDGKP